MSGIRKRPEKPDPAEHAERQLARLEMAQREAAKQLTRLQAELDQKLDEVREAERQVSALKLHRQLEVRAAHRNAMEDTRIARVREVRSAPSSAELAANVAAAAGRMARQEPPLDAGSLVRGADGSVAAKELSSPVNPEKAQNPVEFVEAMNLLKVWSGLSLRKLAERAGPGKLPPSSLADALKKDRLPDLALLRAFVSACGLKKSEVNVWEAHCRALAVKGATPVTVKPVPSRWTRIRSSVFRMLLLSLSREGQALLFCIMAMAWSLFSTSLFPEEGSFSGNVRIMGMGIAGAVLSANLRRKALNRHKSRQESV